MRQADRKVHVAAPGCFAHGAAQANKLLPWVFSARLAFPRLPRYLGQPPPLAVWPSSSSPAAAPAAQCRPPRWTATATLPAPPPRRPAATRTPAGGPRCRRPFLRAIAARRRIGWWPRWRPPAPALAAGSSRPVPLARTQPPPGPQPGQRPAIAALSRSLRGAPRARLAANAPASSVRRQRRRARYALWRARPAPRREHSPRGRREGGGGAQRRRIQPTLRSSHSSLCPVRPPSPAECDGAEGAAAVLAAR